MFEGLLGSPKYVEQWLVGLFIGASAHCFTYFGGLGSPRVDALVKPKALNSGAKPTALHQRTLNHLEQRS